MIQSEILRPENRDVAWNFLSNPFGIFSKDERQGDKGNFLSVWLCIKN